MSTQKIIQTDSISELARFWDSHDLTDFEQELVEVSEPLFERETVISIHLPPVEAEAVKQIAKSKGVDFADLIRDWVVEKAHGV
ncbi:MAG: CopG family antitoxin [Acidobacteriota bacterium]|nr:CopG family antitoxin [Acidobacteriota bacterium]